MLKIYPFIAHNKLQKIKIGPFQYCTVEYKYLKISCQMFNVLCYVFCIEIFFYNEILICFKGNQVQSTNITRECASAVVLLHGCFLCHPKGCPTQTSSDGTDSKMCWKGMFVCLIIYTMSLHVSLPGNLHTGTCTCIIGIFESRLSISSSYDGYSELITLYSPLNCNPLF